MRPIDHVVVLMLENRSFDCMLGWLYPDRPDFDGIPQGASNPWHRDDGTVEHIPAWNDGTLSPHSACIPDPDPGELFEDINMQIFGLHPDGTPRMNGFVDNYVRQAADDTPLDPRAVMHCFVPDQLPVLSTLARSFGVCDRWFASAPCQTWPNRLFVHTGTGGGEVNNDLIPMPFKLPTVFRRLGRAGHSWNVWFHDFPQTAAFLDLWWHIPKHFRLFEGEFADAAAAGKLPNYSFIEPRYFASPMHHAPNDAHPPHNVAYAEQLIADVYNAVRSGPAWDRTLLIVTFDEHGGCYDHVVPPAAISTGQGSVDGFNFDRYGVRVPAVIASPYVPAGSVLRPPEDGPPFDHTSIIATLHALFGIGEPLSPRTATAPDLLCTLQLERPDNPGPAFIAGTDARPTRAEIHAIHKSDRNGHQRRMLWPGTLAPSLLARGIAHTHRAGHRARRGRRP